MKQVVDSSAFLAYILGEEGGDVLASDPGPFYLSSVNLSEIVTKALDRDLAIEDVLSVLKGLPVEQVDFARADAIGAAVLRQPTRQLGLSLGDRACLALANRLDLPVLTADSVWARLRIGLHIRQIR